MAENILPSSNLESGMESTFDPLSSIQSVVSRDEVIGNSDANIFDTDSSVHQTIQDIRSLYKNEASDQPFFKNVSQFKPSILDRAADTRLQTNIFDVPSQMMYTTTSAGKAVPLYESFKYGSDNEERLAQLQSGGQQWGRGLTKAGARFLTVVAGNTAGVAYGVKDAITRGTVSALFDNDFVSAMEDWNTELNGDLRNYKTHVEEQMSTLRQMGNANFWADEVGQGVAFLSGVLASEAIWAGLTGGASIVARGMMKTAPLVRGLTKTTGGIGKGVYKFLQPRYRKYLNSVAKNKVGDAANNFRFLMTSASSEASLEAHNSVRSTIDTYVNNYVSENGRYPDSEELAALSHQALSKANYVYATNLALVGGSNIVQFGSIFGVGKGMGKALSTKLNRVLGLGVDFVDKGGKSVYRALKPTMTQKIIGTSARILKAPITEGVIEEGLQGVISNTHEKWVTAQFDSDAFTQNYGFAQALSDSFTEQYTTKEGLHEVFLGMLIGTMGAIGTGKSGIIKNTFMGDVKAMETRAEAATERMGTLTQQVLGIDLNSDEFNNLSEAEQKAIRNLQNSNRFIAFSNRANASAEQGNFFDTNLNFNMASFAKMLLDDNMGGVEQGFEDFKTVVENMSEDDLVAQGVSRDQVAAYKQDAINSYQTKVEMYKRSKDYINAVDFRKLKKEYGKEDFQAFMDDFHSSIFLGLTSGKSANELATTIDEFVGTRAGGALNVYRRLSAKSRRRAQRMSEVKSEMTAIETEMEDVANKVMAVQGSRNTNAEEADSRLTSLESQRASLNEKLITLRREYTEISNHLNNALDRRRKFSGGLDALFGDSLPEDLDLSNAEALVAEVERFDNFRQTLFTEDREAYFQLEHLINMYEQQIEAFDGFNQKVKALQKADQLTPIAELFREYNSLPNPSQDELFEQYIAGGSFDGSQELVLRKFKEMEDAFNFQKGSLTSIENLRLEPVSKEEYDEWKESGTITPETFERIVNKIALKMPVSAREKEMFEANQPLFIPAISDALLEIGDSIEDAIDDGGSGGSGGVSSSTTTLEDLNSQIEAIKSSRRHLDKVGATQLTKEDIPTEAEFKEYESLLKETNKRLSPKRRGEVEDRLSELRIKLNQWGKLQGARDGDSSIADLIEQKVALEESSISEGVLVEPNYSDTKTLDTANDVTGYEEGTELPFDPLTRKGNHDFLQTYDKAIVSQISNTFEISNVSLEKLASIIESDGVHEVTRKTSKRTGNLVSIRVKNNATGGVFTMRVGERGRIKTAVGNLSKLNATKLRIKNYSVGSTGQVGGYYKTLLQEVATDEGVSLEPVQTDFTLVDGIFMNMEAVYELDSGDSVSLSVDLNDPYNKILVSAYNKKVKDGNDTSKELKAIQDELVIYAKDKKGRIVGVFKNSADSTFTDKDTANTQAYLALKNMRAAATQVVISDNTKSFIDLKTSIPVRNVFAGHPKFNLTSTDGTMKIGLVQVNDNNIAKIVDVGYYVNGNLQLKNNTKEGKLTESPFGRIFKTKKFVASKKDIKIPVAVVEHKGKLIVYPVSLLSNTEGLIEKLDKIRSYSRSTSELAIQVNKFLSEHGLNPNNAEYGVTSANVVSKFESVKQAVESKANLVNVETWKDSRVTLEDIVKNQIAFNIDINGEPFNSPKVNLDFSSVNIKSTSPIAGVNLIDNVPSGMEDSVNQQKECK